MIGIAFGVMLVALLPQLLSFSLIALLVVLLALLFAAQSKLRFRRKVSSQLMGLLIGILYASVWGHLNLSHRMPLNMPTQVLTVEGVVSHLPESRAGLLRFRFEIDEPSSNSSATQSGAQLKHLLLSWYRPDQEVQPGQRWRLTVRVKPPRGYMNPGGHDYETFLFAQQIDAKGYLLNAELLADVETDFRYTAERVRYQVRGWLMSLPLSSTTQATVRALVLGDKQGLDDGQWRILRQTGTVHLAVISGLHIGIACLLGYIAGAIFQRLAGRFVQGCADVRGYRVIPALAFASAYALLAGFSVPTQRALIMALAMLLPVLINRAVSVWQRFLLALVGVLLVQPLSIYQPGFWLSFGAVAALLLTVTREDSTGFVKPLIKTQLAVFFGLSPLLLLWMGQVAVVAPLVNLIAIPALTFIMLPGVLLGLLLCLMDPFAGAALLNFLSDSFWYSLQQVVLPDEQGIIVLHPSLMAALLASLAALILILPGWIGVRGFTLFLLVALIFPIRERPQQGAFRATVLDVGQGLSVLIETEHKTLLYDTGAAYPSGSVARYTLLPVLEQRGIKRLDRLVISHKDNDHAGGYRDLVAAVEVDSFHTGSPLLKRRFDGEPCHSGAGWEWGGVRFSYIQPSDPQPMSENNRSCVLLVQAGDCRLIIPGDIESSVEAQIIRGNPDLKVNWLVAAHHGSRFSSSDLWLRSLEPDRVLFSAGFGNSYGHPAEDVVRRLEVLKVPMDSTVEGGALILTSGLGGCDTHRFREQKKRYWTAG
ncbi:DNA internalization-related competence protein ComEC/Rec2 [Amphritea japonica]|uniref:Competence protein ComEC n=1 Tax=Amphritea japonica ATCC BAA-1530 TaxID=1278309 RepID=A0A7R6P541_9GAMM|nr:DNA internalization-related competence protein ComEC/Rec2 [Amphritea japonica]BBB26094.1 competence protein ComEC [Amphritea japonica ATCC BAA-1530]